MGAYLNPGGVAFEEAMNSQVFVDKTLMIGFLNSVVRTKQKYVCVSRPRRFGKTMAADMICAYYGSNAAGHQLFDGCQLRTQWNSGQTQTWDAYLGAFDVIRIVMTRFFKKKISTERSLANMQRLVVRDIKRAYPNADYFDEDSLAQTIEDVYSDGNRQVVIVIDEWDAVFRERRDDKEGQMEYLDFLRDLLKDNDRIALAYMTGILPIKKYGQHSALNMFTEYSMEAPRQLASYTGFTEDEVRDLCAQYGMDYADVSSWYDGYVLSDRIPADKRMDYRKGTYHGHKVSVYSPLSVVNAVITGQIRNYWNRTETYEALAEYIRMDYDGLKDAVALLMDGGRLRVDTSSYQNDMTTFNSRDDVLALLIHLGYLGFDDDASEVFIPNREILDEFRTSTRSSEWAETFRSFEESQELLRATWNADEERVAELLEKAHDRAANSTYNNEAALSYAIQKS